MNQIFFYTRRRKIALNGDCVRSIFGYEGTDVVHRCLTTTTTTNTPSPSVCNSNTGGDVARTPTRGLHFWQQQRQQQPFQTLSPPLHHQQQQYYYQRLQFRYFVFDSRKVRKKKKGKSPFKVLKIPKESLYKDVKKKFLKVAMSNHPDTHTDGLSEKEQEAMRDKFIEARIAFEMLTEDPSDGTAILVEEKKTPRAILIRGFTTKPVSKIHSM